MLPRLFRTSYGSFRDVSPLRIGAMGQNACNFCIMPHQGESRVTFVLSTQAAKTEPIGKRGALMAPKRCARHHRSPPTRGHPWRIESRAALWDLPETLSLPQGSLLGDFPNTLSPSQGHAVGTFRTRCRCRKGYAVGCPPDALSPPQGPRRADVSPNAKKWQRFAVVNGRMA